MEMPAAAAANPRGATRSGLGYWLHSYRMLVRWEFTNLRLLVPVLIVVMMLSGAGLALGIGLLYEDMPARAALFLSTGVAVITLVLTGLILGPQLVAQQKAEQTYDFMWSLPVPRTTAALAWLTVNLVIGLPAMVAAVLVADWRYDLELAVSPRVVAAVALTLVTATMIGYAIAHAVPSPTATQLVTQVLIFGIIGFSPINFPIENLPSWLGALHRGLPFHHMAILIRDGLTDGLVTAPGRSYAVLTAWAAASAAVAAWTLGRRK